MQTFGDRLREQFEQGHHLCVGIDPHSGLLGEWGAAGDASGAERMGRDVVAAATGVAACVKPQVAFFERFGAAGFIALERVLADARDAGLIVIADAKRGDIGSTFAAYADAWFADGSPLESDALTVSPYLGFEALSGAYSYVRERGKGLFVLAATSNPEARDLQQAKLETGGTVARSIIEHAQAFNAASAEPAVGVGSTDSVGSVGVVLGATLHLPDFGVNTAGAASSAVLPVLAPGFGAQGGQISQARETFGALSRGLLANESRSVLSGGLDGLAGRIRARSEAIALALTQGRSVKE